MPRSNFTFQHQRGLVIRQWHTLTTVAKDLRVIAGLSSTLSLIGDLHEINAFSVLTATPDAAFRHRNISQASDIT